MLKKIQSLLSQNFCSWDPQVKAFNNFYDELIKSEVYLRLAKEIQGHPTPAYNLATPDLYADLETHCEQRTGSFCDIGCGLGVLSHFTPKHPLTAWDFSQSALDFAKSQTPHHNFFLHHQNIGLPTVHKNISHKVAIDSLYPSNNRQPANKYFEDTLVKLLKGNTQSLYVVQNFGVPPHLCPKGFDLQTLDLTDSFRSLISSWKNLLQSEEVKEDAKKFPLLWSTIEREFSQHQRSLNEKPLKRLRLLFTKT